MSVHSGRLSPIQFGNMGHEQENEKKLQALEMDAMSRSCRVSRLEHIANTTIRDKMNIENDIIDRIERNRCGKRHIL